ncbi:MAG: hypothetical protein JST80_09010 [Bdellovibrionales bacterium]|nr:hypothetical protein [Bdellovibrionales bacterium]
MNLHSLLALVAAIFAFQPWASATSFALQKFSTFVNESPFIARGEIHNIFVENGITADGQKTIYTYATFEIKEVFKGNLSMTEVKIRKSGGTKDGFTLEVPGSPEFATGEDAVLFLGQPQEDQSYEVASMELGKFGVEPTGDDFKLTGGLLGYSAESKPGPSASESDRQIYAENSKTWTLSQLRALTRDEVSVGTTSATTQSAPANGEAQKHNSAVGQTDAPSTADADHGQIAAEPNDKVKHATATMKYVVGALIAFGIFFFFKKRG